MLEFVSQYIPIISTFFGAGGVIMYFLENKKHKELLRKTTAQTNQEENAAVKTMQQAYNEFVIDQKALYDQVKGEVLELKRDLKSYKESLSKEKSINSSLTAKINELNTSYNRLEASYNKLQKQFENYRKLRK